MAGLLMNEIPIAALLDPWDGHQLWLWVENPRLHTTGRIIAIRRDLSHQRFGHDDVLLGNRVFLLLRTKVRN